MWLGELKRKEVERMLMKKIKEIIREELSEWSSYDRLSDYIGFSFNGTKVFVDFGCGDIKINDKYFTDYDDLAEASRLAITTLREAIKKAKEDIKYMEGFIKAL